MDDMCYMSLLKDISYAHMFTVSSNVAETFIKPTQPQQRLRVSDVAARCIFFHISRPLSFEVCYRLVTANSSPHSAREPPTQLLVCQRNKSLLWAQSTERDGVRGQRSLWSAGVKHCWRIILANNANLTLVLILKRNAFLWVCLLYWLKVYQIPTFIISIIITRGYLLFVLLQLTKSSAVIVVFSCNTVPHSTDVIQTTSTGKYFITAEKSGCYVEAAQSLLASVSQKKSL